MKVFFFYFNCIILCYYYANCDTEYVTDEGIYVLDDNNFDKFISENAVVLVEFYAPWCGHCKSFAPIYIEIGKKLQQSKPSIPVAKVDGTTATNLSKRFEIEGFPTLKFFKNGQVYEYDGPRSLDDIVSFMINVANETWQPPKKNVLILTKDNFTEIINKNDYILVEFFAPWCGHCKRLAPAYEKAAKLLAEMDPPIPLAAVDATTETDLASTYQITGYPTLKLFRNQKASNYNGPHDADGIVNWMVNNKKDAAVEISSLKMLQNFKKPDKALLLGLFESADSQLLSAFIQATNEVREAFQSVYTFNSDIWNAFKPKNKVNGGSVLILRPEFYYNKHDTEYVEYQNQDSGDIISTMLIEFFEKNFLSLVGEYNFHTRTYYEKFLDSDYYCLFFFTVDFTVEHRSATRLWLNKIADVAVKYKNKIRFAVADDEKYSRKVSEFRLDDSGEDMNVGCYHKSLTKYRMPSMDSFDTEHIEHFLNRMINGLEFPILKSAVAPQVHNKDVQVIVGDAYQKLVENEASPQLILLYPELGQNRCTWCDNASKLMVEMAQKLKSSSSKTEIKFGTIDLRTNEVPMMIETGLTEQDKMSGGLYAVVDHLGKEAESKSGVLKKRYIKCTEDPTTIEKFRDCLVEHVGLPDSTKQEL